MTKIHDCWWERYNNKSYEGKCYCCGDTIYYKNFHVGHNKARAKDGSDHISNLRPICASCNQSMKTISIEEYRKKYFKGQLDVSKKEPRISVKKVTKRDLLKDLAGAKLEKLVSIFDLEPKLPFLPDREDYIKVLINSRRVTVDNIKTILKI